MSPAETTPPTPSTHQRPRVLVTRPPERAGALCAQLAAAGYEPVLAPAITIAPLACPALEAALWQLDQYDWVILTSQNAVRLLWARLQQLGCPIPTGERPRWVAVGRATASALRVYGPTNIWQPDVAVAEAVATMLIAAGVAGQRVLWPRAAGARPVLAEQLRAAGAQVDEHVLYHAVPAPADQATLTALRAGAIEVITLASPSAARALVDQLEGELEPLTRAQIICLGPITAAAATALGLRVDAVATQMDDAGLVEAIARRYPLAK
jgi:uroporphyrinogen-III synthase